MKKKIIVALFLCLLVLGSGLQAFAIPNAQTVSIQEFITEAQRVSRTPGIAISVVTENETDIFFTGVAHGSDNVAVYGDTLFELASVSKAFTALGVLYLEEQGLLSLEDSIADHLPWLTFQYNGQAMDMQVLRLYHFMHHTSGLSVLTTPGFGTLQSGVEALVGAELAFFPGERMEYGNGNYNILGLVIERVSGQSYESFMEEHIFLPLGMTQTFAYRENAIATGNFAQGYATQFVFFTMPRNALEWQQTENIPTGYIISSVRDMTRWMQIQLGLVTDVPEIFHTIIPRSQEPGRSVALAEGLPFPEGSYYAAGWLLNAERYSIEHGGNNGSFTTFVLLLPEEQMGITVLANGCQTIDTAHIALSIADILRGDFDVAYGMSMAQIQDIVFTLVTLLGLLLALVFLVLALKRTGNNNKRTRTKKRIALIVFWAILVIVMTIATIGLPGLMGSGASWSLILSLLSLSTLTGPLALILLFASISLFVAFPRNKRQGRII